MKLDYCVVIPAHNEEQFIGKAIASVLSQSLPPNEVVVVDDGSSDTTSAEAAAAGARVIQQSTSLGPSASRNRAITETRSPFVAFLDADDEWNVDHAETLSDSFADQRVVLAGSRAELFGAASGLAQASLTLDGIVNFRDILIEKNPFVQSAVMVRRTALVAVDGYDERMRLSEDYDLWTRLSELGTFSFVNEITVRRRVHASQASLRFGAEMIDAAWGVRRRTVHRRLENASAVERSAVLKLICLAASHDIEWAVWTGKRSNLALIRAHLSAADESFGLGGSLQSVGGDGALIRRISQDFRNASRSILARLRPSNVAS